MSQTTESERGSLPTDSGELQTTDSDAGLSLHQRLATAEKKLRQTEMLLAVSREVAALKSLDEVLAALVKIATRELGAERSTLFLNDPRSNELFSRVAQGDVHREIRILNTSGIAGAVFQSGEGEVIENVHDDPRFNSAIDEETGFRTESIAAVAVKTVTGDPIGVVQCLNKLEGHFTASDLSALEAITTQAAVTLQSTQLVETMTLARKKEQEFLNIVADVTSELELGALLSKVMTEATRMLNADRSTLFLNDEKTSELFSRVAMGDSIGEIRLPNTAGIAGVVFQSSETINIPHAYADLRFNPAFDKQTGYFTRSILCVPIINKTGKAIGVTQVLNKNGGAFDDEDERRLRAFTGQIAVALESAKLFEDVQAMKNYNDSMLESMSNAVITINEDGDIATCNRAGLQLLGLNTEEIVGQNANTFFSCHENSWLCEKLNELEAEAAIGPTELIDATLRTAKCNWSVNAQFLPLNSYDGTRLGSLIMLEDISSEKRMKSTMSRYMDPGLADQIMGGADELLGGRSIEASVLFSDIRGFTTLTEKLGAQGTVALLNEYFTIMVDCITEQGGMLDKFIGDAIMAGFGLPIAFDDSEDRAVRAGINMLLRLHDWNKERAARGEAPVDIGLGISTDNIVSGNIGSPKRMDYTMIGDGVNLAARLESACKQYHAKMLISEFTYKRLKGTYRIRIIDRVVVKGKTEPVDVYEVLDYHTQESFPNLMDNVNYFNEGTRLYRAAQWDNAIRNYRLALEATPGDKLAELYIDRCETLRDNPPTDWNGVWVMDSK